MLLGLKNKDFLTHELSWMNLEDITPSEISQSQRTDNYDSTHMRYLE